MSDSREHVDELIEHLDRWDVDTRTCLEHIAQALEGIVDRLDDLDRTLSFIHPTDDHPGPRARDELGLLLRKKERGESTPEEETRTLELFKGMMSDSLAPRHPALDAADTGLD